MKDSTKSKTKINLAACEAEFEPHIWARGKEYYNDGCVIDLKRDDPNWRALVAGSEVYSVSVCLDHEGEISDLECDCPYAEDGSACKHMAAALLAIASVGGEVEAQSRQSAKNGRDPENLEDLRAVLEELKPEQLRDYLEELLRNSKKKREHFALAFRSHFAAVNSEEYLNSVNEILQRYLGRDQFIEWDQASDFAFEIGNCLNEIEELIRLGEYETPFQVSTFIFDELRVLDIDDSGGELTWLSDNCTITFLCLAQAAPQSEACEKLLDWACKLLEKSDLDFQEKYIQKLFKEGLNQPDQIARKLQAIERRLDQYKNNEDSYAKYQLRSWLLVKAKVLKAKGTATKELKAILKDYLFDDEIRDYLVDLALEDKAYEEAIQLLKEGDERDREDRLPSGKFSDRLLTLYQELGMNKEYTEERYERLYNGNRGPGRLKDYSAVRQLYSSDQWDQERDRIINKLQETDEHDWLLMKIYEEEGLTSLLAKEVFREPYEWHLKEYEQALEKEYGPQLIDAYTNIIRDKAAKASHRSAYQEVAALMKRVAQLDGGIEAMRKLREEFRVYYKARSALQDELSKLF